MLDRTSPKHFSKNRTEWADTISSAWQGAVLSIINTGDLLIEAREALKDQRGEWSRLIGEGVHKSQLPFSASTAKKLIIVAEDKRFRSHVNALPAAWGTLYELAQLNDEQFERGLKDGIIRPDMERIDAEGLKQSGKDGKDNPQPKPSPDKDQKDKERQEAAEIDKQIEDLLDKTAAIHERLREKEVEEKELREFLLQSFSAVLDGKPRPPLPEKLRNKILTAPDVEKFAA